METHEKINKQTNTKIHIQTHKQISTHTIQKTKTCNKTNHIAHKTFIDPATGTNNSSHRNQFTFTITEINNFRFHGMSSCWLFSSFDGFGGKMKMTAINDFVFGDTFSPKCLLQPA